MKELLDDMMTKYELLVSENKEMKNWILKYNHIIETNKEMKKELGNIRNKRRPEGKMCKLRSKTRRPQRESDGRL